MNRLFDKKSNFIACIFFVFLLLILAVGGFFLTKYLTNEEHEEIARQRGLDSFKSDTSKEIVYFENETIISEEPDIVYKDVVINLQDAKTVNQILKDEMVNIRNSVKKISESEVDPNREILYSEQDIFYALERNYAFYESTNYLSVVVTDGYFDCYSGSNISSVKTYNFSLNNGKHLSNQTLLGFFNTNIDEIKNIIRTKLNTDQLEFNDGNQILIDETLNDINLENMNIYINKKGELTISILVKTSEGSYNDTIELS